jgi:hypothetical protein
MVLVEPDFRLGAPFEVQSRDSSNPQLAKYILVGLELPPSQRSLLVRQGREPSSGSVPSKGPTGRRSLHFKLKLKVFRFKLVQVLQLEVQLAPLRGLSSASRPCLGLLWDGGNSRPTTMYFASCGFELCLNLEPVGWKQLQTYHWQDVFCELWI